LDFVSFLPTALIASLFQGRPDVVVAASPNFFAGVAGALVGIIRDLPFVVEIGDLWPGFVASLGALKRPYEIAVLERIELFMYRRAQRIICLTHSFRDNLVGRGVPSAKIEVILNGVEINTFEPGPPSDALKDQYNPGSLFTIGYIGTQGAAHGLESVLDAAELLPDVLFLFVGDGAEAGALKKKAERAKLINIVFVPQQKRSRMPDFLRLCDVSLVQLRDLPLLRSAIPSKIFEAMATARPILLVAPKGDASALVEQEDCGINVAPGSATKLVQTINCLRADEALRARLGANGRFAAHRYTRERQAREVLLALENAVGTPD
jgi:glycosyltransferase involved in cell wall biosynthesis